MWGGRGGAPEWVFAQGVKQVRSTTAQPAGKKSQVRQMMHFPADTLGGDNAPPAVLEVSRLAIHLAHWHAFAPSPWVLRTVAVSEVCIRGCSHEDWCCSSSSHLCEMYWGSVRESGIRILTYPNNWATAPESRWQHCLSLVLSHTRHWVFLSSFKKTC